jgi:DNA-binding response OmpR family regulator
VDGTPHVLLVEDSELVTGAMTILLENVGARVTVAQSIAQALGVQDRADLVLLDLTLPDGDGLSLAEPLRVNGARRIVALTGRDEPEVRQRCLDAGCSDVLVKPVPARELMTKVSGWISAV